MTLVLDGEDDPNSYADDHNDAFTAKIRDDIQGSVGMPLVVQVIALPYRDELALGVMKVIEDELQFKTMPQISNL